MTDWTDGYVTTTEYTAHFYPYLAPSVQNFALLLSGYMPVDLSGGYTYCELGCGRGYSTALLAAANPGGHFWGVDFNPAHIAGAEKMKAAAGIANVTFLEKSFVELTAMPGLPSFDFIALHGVWSWINAANRDAIVSFVYSKLKPGGVVYISYNCLPGWAAIAPLRQLMVESQRHRPEMDAPSADAAIALAKRMRDLQQGYFAANPQAGANLDMIEGMSRNYLLHEYFNRDWAPFYFSDVAADLKAAKLSYACSNSLVEQIEQLCLTPDAIGLLKDVTDTTARETIKDYFLNSRFRRDQFTRGARKLSQQERASMMEGLRLVLTGPMPAFPLQIRVPIGAITIPAEPCRAIAEALAEGPLTFGELKARPGLSALASQAVFQGLLMLAAANLVQPCLPGAGEERRRESVARFNTAMLLQPAALESAMMASTVLGNGTSVPQLDQFILSLQAAGKSLSPLEVLREMDARNIKLRQAGVPDGAAANTLQMVEAALEEFIQRRLPIYHRLGVAP